MENFRQSFIKITEVKKETEKEKGLFNLDFFLNDKERLADQNSTITQETPKRGRPKKNIITSDSPQEELGFVNSNVPYKSSYVETENMLKGTINQIDMLSIDVIGELKQIKESTLRKKHDIMSELTNTATSLIQAKITAIREINKTTTDSHNLDIRRIRELKLNENPEDDDKTIQDMYHAFINTPVNNSTPNMLGPSFTDITLSSSALQRMDLQINGDQEYTNYLSNMTPEQNRMRNERNPNVKTVVVYDQTNGNRSFDVVDTTTNTSVPNMPRPDNFILENMQVNLQTGIARNSDLELTYPIIVVGTRAMDEY